MRLESRGCYDLTDVDTRKLVADVYDKSVPVGMGMLHYKTGQIPQEVLEQIMQTAQRNSGGVRMDYVLGRQCKFNVQRSEDGRLYCSYWGDHSQASYVELMKRNGAVKIRCSRCAEHAIGICGKRFYCEEHIEEAQAEEQRLWEEKANES